MSFHRNFFTKKSLLIFLTFWPLISCREVPESPAASDKYRLVWTDDPTSTMTIAWDQLSGANPVVFYGKVDHGRKYWKYENLQTAQTIRQKYEMNNHFAFLSGLSADSKYYFVIHDKAGVSERYWFRTAPDTPQAFTFVTGGDTKSDGAPLEAGRASNQLVAKLRPLFVLFNGDFNSGDGLVPDRWKQWLTDWHQMTTTVDGRMIPLIPVHGNHENGDHANLHYMFNTPYQNGDSASVYYSLSFGGDFFHLISLNSEIDEGGEQKKWLEQDLTHHRHFTFKVAGYHKPFWPHTSRKSENEYQYNQWAALFYEYGLNVSLDGDSHMHKMTYPLRPDSASVDSYMGFVRDDEKGIMFLGEGSWGAKPRASDDEKPWTIATASYNQLKWVHVIPQESDNQAHMAIHTIITGSYDEEDQRISYVESIETLSEENRFDIPENAWLFENGNYGKVVNYPIELNELEALTEPLIAEPAGLN